MATPALDRSNQTIAPLDQDLITKLGDIRRTHNLPVLAVALQTDETPKAIVLGGSVDTPLRWGSITKTVTALTVLKLAARGLVDLSAPLQRYLPSHPWQNPWRATHPVRVIDLLELRAGFPDLSAEEFSFNEPVDLKTALAINPDHRKALWPPGLQHAYSNMAPGLTQLLIESLTGKPFASVVRAELFDPLGMASATFAPDPALPGGFKADGITSIPYWHMTFPAYGAMNASLRDMLKLLQAIEHLSPQVAGYLRHPSGRRLAPEFLFDYAAGFYPRIRNRHLWYTHGGDADGYRARLALLHDENNSTPRAYIVNLNVDAPAVLRQIERLLEARITSQIPTPEPTPSMTDVDLNAFTGTFYPASVRFGIEDWLQGRQSTVTLEHAGNSLVFKRGTKTTRLLPVGANQFRRPRDPVATVVFVHDGNTLYLQGVLGNFARTDACPDFMDTIPICRLPQR